MTALSAAGLGVGIALAMLGANTANAGSISLAEKLEILKNTYPAVISEIRGSEIVLKSGKTIVTDDGRDKDHQSKLKYADVEDSLSQIYPLGVCDQGPPTVNFDPGRIRNSALMRSLYGDTEAMAKATLRKVEWFGRSLPVTTRHGVDVALESVRDDLKKSPKKIRKYLVKPGGSFSWRVIAGTDRLSVHSFGAAIDINTKYTDYWRWAGGQPGDVPIYKNKIPKEIVEVFERHDFIWGGKWYHFDTMHFEYRPELIAIGKLAESRGCDG